MNTKRNSQLTTAQVLYFMIAFAPQLIFMKLVSAYGISQQTQIYLVLLLTAVSGIVCLGYQILLKRSLDKKYGGRGYRVYFGATLICVLLNFLFSSVMMIFVDAQGYVIWSCIGFLLVNSMPMFLPFCKYRVYTLPKSVMKYGIE